jgi:hypothetical protein
MHPDDVAIRSVVSSDVDRPARREDAARLAIVVNQRFPLELRVEIIRAS